MKLGFRLLLISIYGLSMLACSNSTTTNGNNILGGTNGTVPNITGNNVLRVEVGLGGAGLCNGDSYENEPCTSVTICSPNSLSNCQTINNILVDTGSYGLRVFSSAMNSNLLGSLTQQTTLSPSGGAAECAEFGTGSTWGPVDNANVILGGEAGVTMPIQVINTGYPSATSGGKYCSFNDQTGAACNPGSSNCIGPDASPKDAGYNGILGVGLFAEDCGTTCVTSTAGTYYECTGSTCTEATIALTSQVINPVAKMPVDNTGVMMVMPSVASAGTTYNYGWLVLGVSTQSNNRPSNTQTYTADSNLNDANYGGFVVTYGGTVYGGFIDSGSNGYFFPANENGVASCSDNSSWLCPSGVISQTAINKGLNGVSASTQFLVANADTLFNSNNYLFDDLGGEYSNGFDWGLPFFYGRYVYVGLEGQTAQGVGTGPYWAY